MSYAKDQHARKHNPNTPKKAADRFKTRRVQQTDTPIGWDEVDAMALYALVCAATNAGDAVTFGRTSDGGALSVCILTDGPPHKEYYTDADQALSALRELAILSAA
jgi:hypothetical protein